MKSIKLHPGFYFVYNILIFAFIVYCIDLIGGAILKNFYFNQQSGFQHHTTYAIDSTNAEILVFGSSRANHHYVSEEVEKASQSSTYNVGREGQSIFYHYAVFKGVLARYKPKVVILDLLNSEFDFEQDSYDRLSELLPYYKSHPSLQPILNYRSWFESFKMISKIYPYNSSLLTIAIGNTEFNKKRFVDYKGYQPLYRQFSGSLNSNGNGREINKHLDTNKINIYKAFINDCKSNNIKLYVVISPYLKEVKESRSSQLAKQIAYSNNINFLNYSQDSAFVFKPEFFDDEMHLNNTGAEFFTKKLIVNLEKDSYKPNHEKTDTKQWEFVSTAN